MRKGRTSRRCRFSRPIGILHVASSAADATLGRRRPPPTHLARPVFSPGEARDERSGDGADEAAAGAEEGEEVHEHETEEVATDRSRLT